LLLLPLLLLPLLLLLWRRIALRGVAAWTTILLLRRIRWILLLSTLLLLHRRWDTIL
jgi:hypothetical protein